MDLTLLLLVIADILNAYDEQHDLDETGWLQGWWVISPDEGWAWWLGVYSEPPAGQDLDYFPYCLSDAPLPNWVPRWPV